MVSIRCLPFRQLRVGYIITWRSMIRWVLKPEGGGGGLCFSCALDIYLKGGSQGYDYNLECTIVVYTCINIMTTCPALILTFDSCWRSIMLLYIMKQRHTPFSVCFAVESVVAVRFRTPFNFQQ